MTFKNCLLFRFWYDNMADLPSNWNISKEKKIKFMNIKKIFKGISALATIKKECLDKNE